MVDWFNIFWMALDIELEGHVYEKLQEKSLL